MTVLAWGGISYKDGYKSAPEYANYENLLRAIKWGTDYFIKCHVSENEFYGQVTQCSICNYNIYGINVFVLKRSLTLPFIYFFR